jgi:hypothetical protein
MLEPDIFFISDLISLEVSIPGLSAKLQETNCLSCDDGETPFSQGLLIRGSPKVCAFITLNEARFQYRFLKPQMLLRVSPHKTQEFVLGETPESFETNDCLCL